MSVSAHLGRDNANQSVTTTSYSDVSGLSIVGRVPPSGRFTVKATLPTGTVATSGQSGNYTIARGDTGSTTPMGTNYLQAGIASQNFNSQLEVHLPTREFAPTAGSLVTFRVQCKTSLVSSAVQTWSGDLLGEKVPACIRSDELIAPYSMGELHTEYVLNSSPADDYFIFRPDYPDKRNILVICLRGSGQTGLQFAVQGATGFWQIPAMIAAKGFWVLCPGLNGTTPTWGNATASDIGGRIDAAITWAGTNLGTRTDKVGIVGLSAGTVDGLNWAWRQPTRLACMGNVLNIPNMQTVHDSNRLGLATAMETAHGGSAGTFNAAMAARNPSQNATLIAPIRQRTRSFISAADPVGIYSEQQTFDSTAHVINYAIPSVAHDITGWDCSELANFMAANIGQQ